MSKEEKQPQPSGEAIMGTPGPELHGEDFILKTSKGILKPKSIPLPEAITSAVQQMQAQQACVEALIQGFIFGNPFCEEQTVYDVTTDGKFLVKRQSNE